MKNAIMALLLLGYLQAQAYQREIIGNVETKRIMKSLRSEENAHLVVLDKTNPEQHEYQQIKGVLPLIQSKQVKCVQQSISGPVMHFFCVVPVKWKTGTAYMTFTGDYIYDRFDSSDYGVVIDEQLTLGRGA